MRKYRKGEYVKISMPDFTVAGTILSISPCGKFCKVRLDDDCELLIETKFIEHQR